MSIAEGTYLLIKERKKRWMNEKFIALRHLKSFYYYWLLCETVLLQIQLINPL